MRWHQAASVSLNANPHATLNASAADRVTGSAHDFCLLKWADTAVRLNPVYRPTPEEVKRGQDAFMGECMANQGY